MGDERRTAATTARAAAWRRRARPTAIVTAAVALLALAGTASYAATPAIPIPSDPRDATVAPFLGAPATARPMAAVASPQNPWMAPNGKSNIHDDGYQTDTYRGTGPLGHDLAVSSTELQSDCASVTFDSHGRIVTVCVSVTGATLRLIDPDSLATLASYDLPPRKPGTFSFTNFSGGGYFYLDNRDRAVVATFTGHLLTLATDGTAWKVVRDVDISAATGGSGVQSALPDWSGRLWFVTGSGVVGFVTRHDRVRSVHLPAGEVIANSFAMDESGGVFVVSDHALYRFDVGHHRPSTTWRRSYDRGTHQKPGQVSQGSGTTPTLIGRASRPGGGWVAITDNADPRMHVLVFRRGKHGPGHQPVCSQAVFPKGHSDDENSLISVPGGLIAENNDGYDSPLPTKPLVRSVDTTPGVVKVHVDYRRGGCHIAWRNTIARIPTLVSKVSLGNGLLYSYTHPAASELQSTLPDPLTDLTAPDAWYFTAFDARTGRQVWSKLVGSGIGYNNNYAPVSLSPSGVAYVGTLGGLVRVADTP